VTAEHIGDQVEVTFDPTRLDVKAIRTVIAAAGYHPSS
jgi:copper chaperone CopZ